MHPFCTSTLYFYFCLFSLISIGIVSFYNPDHISLIGGN
nr:MAG TPA: hypothetical protein [Caudoviricetes sp.]